MYRFLKPVLVSLTCWLVLPLISDVRCMDRREIIKSMNKLLANPGWQTMVVIVKEPSTNTLFSSEILPYQVVNEDNVNMNLRLMSMVLSCKYADLVLWYVEAMRLILVEGQKITTPTDWNWNRFPTIMVTIERLLPFLVNMLTAVRRVNQMDETLTVNKFELNLNMLIKHIELLYDEHKYVMRPVLNTVITFDLLRGMYKKFMVPFVTYSLALMQFLDGYCQVELVPDEQTFEEYYKVSQPSLPHPMDMCAFLFYVVNTTIEENRKQFHDDLGFQ